MKKWEGLENSYGQHIGSVLVVALVAVSAFMLGADYESKKNDTGNVSSQATDTETVEDSVSQLQTTLSGESTPAPATTTPTPAATTTTPKTTSGLININTAGLAELDTLPGIGPAYAQAIIDYRNQNGLFVSVEDLDKVKGIGPKTLDKLRPLITI